MKYRVITVSGDEQKVFLETDDFWIAFTTADAIDKYPICVYVYIDKEEEQ